MAKERERCEAISPSLERINAELDQFRSVFEPAYSMWFHSEFGQAVTEIRDLEAKASELGRLVNSVEAEAYLSGSTEKAAFLRLERAKAGAKKLEEMRSQQKESAASSHEDPAFSDSGEMPPEVEELLKMSFEQMFGHGRFSGKEQARMFEQFKQSFREDVFGKKQERDHGANRQRWEERRTRSRPNTRKAAQVETPEDQRRKRLYRDLARQLHPDLNKEQSPKEQSLWHEVRAAYESKNLETLETLAALLESGSDLGFSRIGSVSRLQAIYRDFEKKLKDAKRALKQAKKAPSWNFQVASAILRTTFLTNKWFSRAKIFVDSLA